MDKLLDILKSAGFPYAYDHFAEGEAPDPPFVCYLLPGSDNFSADGKVYYRISDTERTLYASEPDGFIMGFGAFLYQSSEKERKDNLFQNMLRHREYFILELTGIPEQEKRDQELVFAALFAASEKEEGRAYMEEEMNDVAWLMETILGSRAADGTRR